MARPLKEHVTGSLNMLNKMIDDYSSNNKNRINDVVEIKEYLKDCKHVLKRALLMSNREIFNSEELSLLKEKIGSFEQKINNLNSKTN